MAEEMTVPLLPCRSIDDIADFYRALGFQTTYRQQRPNPYVAIQREDLHLHFFGIADFVPADSYGTCLVVVPDVGELHRAFAARRWRSPCTTPTRPGRCWAARIGWR